MEKKLYLSRSNKIIAGVCGGIAEYFNVDATLIRIMWVVLFILTGIIALMPFVLYIICWAVMPLPPE